MMIPDLQTAAFPLPSYMGREREREGEGERETERERERERRRRKLSSVCS